MPNQDNENRWKLDKNISVGNVIAILVLAISFTGYTNTLDKRIEQNTITQTATAEQIGLSIAYLSKNQDKQEEVSRTFRREVRDWLKTIDGKLSQNRIN
ncbi:hypothetical protein [Vibrio algicola]|uniref:Uncharacterized protein n=1 Tax=Vibrio algicola TaxID=2662262 RepID=A0A5Q0TCB0_9VIBR|nr:hypothetical protein [Vibrio algicola]